MRYSTATVYYIKAFESVRRSFDFKEAHQYVTYCLLQLKQSLLVIQLMHAVPWRLWPNFYSHITDNSAEIYKYHYFNSDGE